MDSRLYFVLGDLTANIGVGMIAAWLSWLVIGVGWNMWLAMVLAMVLGMLVATLLFPLLSLLWGAMEVIVPTMLSGMLSGMVVGMWAAMTEVSPGAALFVGGAFGLAGIVIVWVVNNTIRTPFPIEGGDQ